MRNEGHKNGIKSKNCILYMTSVWQLRPRLPDCGSTLVDQPGEDGLHVVQEEILESLLVLRVADHEEDLALPLRHRFPSDGNVRLHSLSTLQSSASRH
jgi:hypothetical protein